MNFDYITLKHDAPFMAADDIDAFISENGDVVFTELVKCVEKMIETNTDTSTVFLCARFTNFDADLFIDDNEISTGEVNGKLNNAMAFFIRKENYEMCKRIKTIQNKINANKMQNR